MILRSIQEAEAALLPYVPLVKQFTGADMTLERIQPLMQLLGNPQDNIQVVHVAGTSGKTSTSYYIAELLCAAGKSVGLTVSPHVDSITERLQIDGKPVSDEFFCEQLGEFLDIVKESELKPTYFELLQAFVLWVFNCQKLDYVVVETGMGGLHDASNIITRADKVCVITDIGFDHMHILGNTLPEITEQKIGIVHTGNTVLMYEQTAEIMTVVEAWVRNHGAKLIKISEEGQGSVENSALPLYQQRNWHLAYEVYEYVRNRDKLQHLTSQVLLKTQSVQIPARMQTYQINSKTIIMDGAHNKQKMTAFLESFEDRYPNQKPAVVIALKESKDYEEAVALLAPIASEVIVTKFDTSQDLPARSVDPQQVAHAFLKLRPDLPVQIEPDHEVAFQRLLQSKSNFGIITGSFYLIGQIRRSGAY